MLYFNFKICLSYCRFYYVPSNALQFERNAIAKCNHLTIISLNQSKEKSISEWCSHFWEWGKSPVTKKLITRMKKKLSPLRVKNDFSYAIQFEIAWANEQKAHLKCLWRHIVVNQKTRWNRKQEKANNNLNYRFAAINEKNLAGLYFPNSRD